MSKVYIFMADGCETIEALTPVDIFRRADISAVTVSIMGHKEIQTAQGVTFHADGLFEEQDFSDGDMFVLPGGMPGTTNLAAYSPLIELLKKKDAEGKHIAAICAAPALVLGENGFLTDKKACCYPGMESHLLGAIQLKDPVVTDGNITTSRGMGTAIPFSLELIRVLQGEKASSDMSEKIVYSTAI